MAKQNGDPFGVADAAKDGKFNGQIGGADGPKTMKPKELTELDRDHHGSGDNGASKVNK